MRATRDGGDPLQAFEGTSTALADMQLLMSDRPKERNGARSWARRIIRATRSIRTNTRESQTCAAQYGVNESGNEGLFRFTGQIWLPELGLYHYKARMYSPTLGRFMQSDPIGYADGMNFYAYVGNDPVNFVDPTGLLGTPAQQQEWCRRFPGGYTARQDQNGDGDTDDEGETEIVACGGFGEGSTRGIVTFRGLSRGPRGPGGGGGGSRGSRRGGNSPQSENTCSTAAQVGAYASNANLVLEGSAAVLGIGVIATSPTGVGGGVLGAGAAVAAGGAKLASVVSIGAYGYDYLTTGNTSSLVGAGAGVISLVSSGVATKVTGNIMRSGRMFGNLSAPQAARLSTAEAVYGSAAGTVESLLVDTGC